MTTRTRIAPLSPPYTEDVEASLRKWMPKESALEPLKLFRTVARNAPLSDRLRHLGAFFLGHGKLPMRTRELVILRTCARCGAEYEWGVHVAAFAKAAGLDATAVGATVQTPSPAEGVDALVLRAVDELHDEGTIVDATWAGLASHFDDEALLELVALAGFYHVISFIVRAAGVEHEPWATRFPG